MLRRKKISHN